jgi:hypothetical protein
MIGLFVTTRIDFKTLEDLHKISITKQNGAKI